MQPWLVYSVIAAIFASLTSILAKIGLQNINTYLATAIKISVVVFVMLIIVFVNGAYKYIYYVSLYTWLFLIMSGICTGASWVCYFRALQLGNVNKVVPIDKSSTVITMVLAFIILNEPLNVFTIIGMTLILVGTFFMVMDSSVGSYIITLIKNINNLSSATFNVKTFFTVDITSHWLFYAVLSAIFASLTAIVGKLGIVGIDVNLGITIRTVAILPLSWVMVIIVGSNKNIKISRKNVFFLILSSLTTCISWLFFYYALQIGNVMHVIPIDRLSIILTMAFCNIFLGEKFSYKNIFGLILLSVGAVVAII